MEYEAKLSDIIASLPEVSGGFLYSIEKGVYANQTSDFAGDASIEKICSKLINIVSMLTEHYQDTGGIRVSFKEYILYGTQIAPDHWLFLLHQPSLSTGMIKMTVGMAMNIEAEESPTHAPEAPSQENSPAPTENTTSDAGESIMDILLAPESELRDPLSNMEEQLAHFIGPVAGLIFKDSVEAWARNGTPSMENFPALLDMIENEIDDEDDSIAFRKIFSVEKGE